MSIVLERNSASDNRIERSGLAQRMACFPIYNSPVIGAGEYRAPAKKEDHEDDDRTSSSSSSIGRNSDDESPAGRSSSSFGGADRDRDGEEVESAFKPGALDNLDALEEVLPIKRGVSNFYAGKSKSFTCLADAAKCSSKDIVKPENAYTRKRKNLFAYNNLFDKLHSYSARSKDGGIYKRPTNSRSSLALSANLCCSESNNSSESWNSNPSLPRFSLPPLPPQSRRCSNEPLSLPSGQKFSGWRSFSLSDLQGAAATPSQCGIKK